MNASDPAWRAAIWDRPQNGTRYCVQRRNPDAFAGVDTAEIDNERGGVLTFPSRAKAAEHADRLNKERAR